jgi:phenylacetic acid degradation operon negative regulatory protein
MKPTSIILDLLRTYGARGTSVQDIANTGALFGFNDNRIRVSLSRLRAKGVIESCSRGHYRLCNTTDPVNAFAERWRLGEQRVTAWHGQWTCVHLPGSEKTGKSQWALSNFGFAAMDPSLWIRPNNLSQRNEELKQQLHILGVPRDGIFITAAELEPVLEQAWLKTFEPTKLNRRYLEMITLLEKSLTTLRKLPEPMAKKESFDLGGRGIQMLAKDPLLPEQMQHPATREKLWQTMCRYDEVGRQVWAGQYKPDVTPTSQTEFTNTGVTL